DVPRSAPSAAPPLQARIATVPAAVVTVRPQPDIVTSPPTPAARGVEPTALAAARGPERTIVAPQTQNLAGPSRDPKPAVEREPKSAGAAPTPNLVGASANQTQANRPQSLSRMTELPSFERAGGALEPRRFDVTRALDRPSAIDPAKSTFDAVAPEEPADGNGNKKRWMRSAVAAGIVVGRVAAGAYAVQRFSTPAAVVSTG